MAIPIRAPLPDNPHVHRYAVVPNADALVNLTAGMGTTRQKSAYSGFIFDQRMNRAELDAMYRTDWLSAAVVEIPADDMTREGRTLTGLEADEIQDYERAETQLGVWKLANEAIRWARLYGGCGIILGIDGAGEMSEELDPERVQKGALKWIRTVDRNFLIPELSNNLRPHELETFGRPTHYRAYGGPDLIHRSRILFFYGAPLPYTQTVQELFWGQSIIERLRVALLAAATAQSASLDLIIEAKVDVFSVPNLMSLFEDATGTAQVLRRFEIANQAKSTINAILLDANEEWEQKTGAITPGVKELLEQFLDIVAGAADIPVTRLMGQSSKGLNATGEGDLQNYYDAIAAKQKNELRPPLTKLDDIHMRSIFGKIPDELSWTFDPLEQEDKVERASVELSDAQADQTYLDLGAVQEHHVAARLLQTERYPTLTQEWVDELEKNPPAPPAEPDPLGGLGFLGSRAKPGSEANPKDPKNPDPEN